MFTYVYPLLYSPEETGISRDKVFKALVAEGVPIADRYVNIHLLPIYQKKMAYGTNRISLERGLLPGTGIL